MTSSPSVSFRETLSPLLQTLLARRGIVDDETAREFLFPDYDRDIRDPFGIIDMERAAVRILKAMAQNESILIYSDYDCDGIPGGTLLRDLFDKVGYAEIDNVIPHRHRDGYGLKERLVREAHERGVTLIITVDCGITNHEEVVIAQKLGIDVIVTDHHLVQEEKGIPPAYAVVNSKRKEDTYHDSMLCGAGVAWKLSVALLRAGRGQAPTDVLAAFDALPGDLQGRFRAVPDGWEKWLLDMAGLSTIADMVPLLKENRAIASFGLTVLRRSRRPGLVALLREAGISQRDITEDDVGFSIGPRVNAASRMDDPEIAFRVFHETDPLAAQIEADRLAHLNGERKTEVARIMKEAHGLAAHRLEHPVLVIGHASWRVGVVGLVANQLVEKYGKPAFVWGKEGSEVIKGSCRSDGTVNIVALMSAVREGIFLDIGGHEEAGGFSVHKDGIHHLEEALCVAFAEVPKKDVSDDVGEPDADLSVADVTRRVYEDVSRLAPFGQANPKPIFRVRATLLSAELFGKTKEHLKMRLRDPESGKEAVAIAFFMTPESAGFSEHDNGAIISFRAHLERSVFRGREEVRLRFLVRE